VGRQPRDLGEFTAPSASGKTELMQAAGDGALERVAALLDSGAEIDERNANGGTALMYAVSYNHLEVVRLLLAQGADPNAQARIGWTPLLVAAAKGRAGAIRLLLEAGAAPAARDGYGWTPLMRAVSGGYIDAVDACWPRAAPRSRRARNPAPPRCTSRRGAASPGSWRGCWTRAHSDWRPTARGARPRTSRACSAMRRSRRC
jgi:hypothetical protein